MKRYDQDLGWLNHDQRPAEQQSPRLAAGVVALLAFVLLAVCEHRFVSLAPAWWEQLLCYACIPVMLAFVVLYRSAWHEHASPTVRALWAATCSFAIFIGVLLVIFLALMVVCVGYIAYGGLTRFDY